MAAMTPEMVMGAFDAESRRLSEVAAGVDEASFARPSPCPPWTAGELLYHVQMTMERLGVMLAAPEPPGTRLVAAPGYYRADLRFSAGANADRIRTAQHGADALPDAAARARDFEATRKRIWSLLRAAPPERVVRTRHGDRMLLTEFLRTRVLELAVHGLDLAVALDREPWMTAPAAAVTEEILLTPPAGATLRALTGWDPVTLIAKLTGRVPASAGEIHLISSTGIRPLALG